MWGRHPSILDFVTEAQLLRQGPAENLLHGWGSFIIKEYFMQEGYLFWGRLHANRRLRDSKHLPSAHSCHGEDTGQCTNSWQVIHTCADLMKKCLHLTTSYFWTGCQSLMNAARTRLGFKITNRACPHKALSTYSFSISLVHAVNARKMHCKCY